MTVQPVSGKSDLFFTAVPVEPDSVREARIEKEREDRRLAAIDAENERHAKAIEALAPKKESK